MFEEFLKYLRLSFDSNQLKNTNSNNKRVVLYE